MVREELLDLTKDGKMLEIVSASYFQTFEYVVESNLKWIEEKEEGNADVLELDVLAKVFSEDSIVTSLIECKRGCTFNDLFKFSGVSNLIKPDESILIAQSHEITTLKTLGGTLNISVVEPYELADAIFEASLSDKFELFFASNSLCNGFIDKENIKKVLAPNRRFTEEENRAYNNIRSYLAELIGKIWRENNLIKKVTKLNELFESHKGFVRYIASILNLKPGNRQSEFYMDRNPLCQAAGFLVLKIKIAYLIAAVECAIRLTDKEVADLNQIDASFYNVVLKLRNNLVIAKELPKFIQKFVFIFGGYYCVYNEDLQMMSDYMDLPLKTTENLIKLMKNIFVTPEIGIQWGFIEDMGVSLLRYVPTPLKGLGILNRNKLNIPTDVFCFSEQWVESLRKELE